MKKIVFCSFILLALITNLNAYEQNGDLLIKWTGFKTLKKTPVSGTFKDIEFSIIKNKKLEEFLKSAKVSINTSSFNSKDDFRDKNITSTLFSLASAKKIEASISKVNIKDRVLNLKLTMNETTKDVPMRFEILNDLIYAKGSIDILDYNMKNSFLAFAKKCASFHENKSYSDVEIEFSLPYKN
ncbi:YceI family protein [Arcobacter sp. YIC-464]|uniref:YceI family protein n=1 Tax=Arcobacter sp. YIC-464 TaxID=3376631 RepID=UPI003C29DE5B